MILTSSRSGLNLLTYTIFVQEGLNLHGQIHEMRPREYNKNRLYVFNDEWNSKYPNCQLDYKTPTLSYNSPNVLFVKLVG